MMGWLMSLKTRFSVTHPGADRIHHVAEADVQVVLSRLPVEVRSRLRAVHFNDGSHGARLLGYANPASGEIALCALPPRMSLRRFLLRGQSSEEFGATPTGKWPDLAIRRFLLYDVFLHELGHLQAISDARTDRLRYAREKLAEDFATIWRHELWSSYFGHPDPVHNRPRPEVTT